MTAEIYRQNIAVANVIWHVTPSRPDHQTTWTSSQRDERLQNPAFGNHLINDDAMEFICAVLFHHDPGLAHQSRAERVTGIINRCTCLDAATGAAQIVFRSKTDKIFGRSHTVLRALVTKTLSIQAQRRAEHQLSSALASAVFFDTQVRLFFLKLLQAVDPTDIARSVTKTDSITSTSVTSCAGNRVLNGRSKTVAKTGQGTAGHIFSWHQRLGTLGVMILEDTYA